jgi:hypothetical protein
MNMMPLLFRRSISGHTRLHAFQVAAGEELPAGGEEELEIRATTISAVEDLKEAIRSSGRCACVVVRVCVRFWAGIKCKGVK